MILQKSRGRIFKQIPSMTISKYYLILMFGMQVIVPLRLYGDCCYLDLGPGEVCCEGQPVPIDRCCNKKIIYEPEECCLLVRPNKPYVPDLECCETSGVVEKYVITDLDKCLHRRQRDGWVPRSNGCGTPAIPVPNSWQFYTCGGQAGYYIVINTGSCNVHDKCYDKCYKAGDISGARENCDVEFYNNMKSSCADQLQNQMGPEFYTECGLGTMFACMSNAALYYEAVREAGWISFNKSQREACQCCL